MRRKSSLKDLSPQKQQALPPGKRHDTLYRWLADRLKKTPETLSLSELEASLNEVPSELAATAVELNALGELFFRRGLYPLARVAYGRAALNPAALGAKVNLGQCDIRLGYPLDAEENARQILAFFPDFIPALDLLGESLLSQKRYDEAIEVYKRAIEKDLRNIMLWCRLGLVNERAHRLEEACRTYRKAYDIDPADQRSLWPLIVTKRRLCDWRELDTLSAKLRAFVERGNSIVSPLDFIAEGATAAAELRCARAQATRVRERSIQPFRLGPIRWLGGSEKLKVGFVSRGFGAHPTAVLTSAMFERLGLHGIDAHLLATSASDGSSYRRRFEQAPVCFHDASRLSSVDVAKLAHEMELDILVDLDGYCRGQRADILALRPCPIQVNWLGYPGTTGADFIDYIIADRYVLPPWLQKHFSEKVAYLPRCYQSTDPTREIPSPSSRASYGLPSKGIVYVSFNASFKLNPRSFMRMARILSKVPQSILWLLRGPGQAEQRLRQMARTLGIAPDRLIFMDKREHADYLACYRHADLFLDSENYNAHTTASDAIWAGCPVLTRPGGTFATRVAGSINHHLGMLEMNARSDEDFIEHAVRFGRDMQHRESVRLKLSEARESSTLFDVEGFTEDFAALLKKLARHQISGGTLPPVAANG